MLVVGQARKFACYHVQPNKVEYVDECKKIIKDMNLQLISKKYVITKKEMVNDLHFYYNKRIFRDVYSILIL